MTRERNKAREREKESEWGEMAYTVLDGHNHGDKHVVLGLCFHVHIQLEHSQTTSASLVKKNCERTMEKEWGAKDSETQT
jgi:hypothetical protein